MASLVLKVLGLTLGVFFIFVGTIKLTPSVNSEIYKEMVRSRYLNKQWLIYSHIPSHGIRTQVWILILG